jgi:hypothetical protein
MGVLSHWSQPDKHFAIFHECFSFLSTQNRPIPMTIRNAHCVWRSFAILLSVIFVFCIHANILTAWFGKNSPAALSGAMNSLASGASDSSIVTPDKAISSTFFGMHIHRAGSTTPWPVAPFSSWRLWDASAAWAWLEPSKGKWSFDKLDNYVALAEAHKTNILLVLGFPPQWAASRPNESGLSGMPGSASEPANMDDWRNYVRTVATRYKGRIKNYELWNEPDVAFYYTGTATQMAALAREAYAVLKEVDPTNMLGSPPITIRGGISWLRAFFEQGGGAYADMIGVHIYVYPDAPEAMIGIYRTFTALLAQYNLSDKPIWNTEMGWSLPKEFPNDKEAAAFVARSYVLNWALGISRFYWYAWDNTNWVTLRLTKNDCATLTSAGYSYGEISRWLLGNRIVSCSQNSQGAWIAQIVRSDTQTAWILWHPTDSVAFSIPDAWHVTKMRDLAGKVQALASTQINLDYYPMCLYSGSGVWLEEPQKLQIISK